MLTAVIPHYNRTNAIQTVLESLSACPAIDDIIIWQSGEALENRWAKRLTLLGEPGKNEFTWGRFLAARQAKHRLIYTQDDDCIVTPDAIARLAGLALDSGRWACYLRRSDSERSRDTKATRFLGSLDMTNCGEMSSRTN